MYSFRPCLTSICMIYSFIVFNSIQFSRLNLSSARTPPWLEAQRAEEMRLLDFWNSSPKFQANFIEEFIKDSVYLDVQGICSGQSAALRTNDRNEAQALIYLENHVITDEVALLCGFHSLYIQCYPLKPPPILQPNFGL